MVPPTPQDAPAWFVPYIYTPSESATYAKLVTPLGNIHLEGALKDHFASIVAAIFVGLLTVTWWSFRSHRRSVASRTGSRTKTAKPKSTKAGSALEENIQTKGTNSYYYAHQRHTIDEPSKANNDGLQKTMISSYSWTDNKKTVSIFMLDDCIVDMAPEQLQLKWTATSLSMDLLVAADSRLAKSLVIPTLFDEITNVDWKTKENRLTLTLHKANPAPWSSLNSAAKNLEDHIEYDDSLYD